MRPISNISRAPKPPFPSMRLALAWHCPVGPSPGKCQPLMLPRDTDGTLGRAAEEGCHVLLFCCRCNPTVWHILRFLFVTITRRVPSLRCALSKWLTGAGSSSRLYWLPCLAPHLFLLQTSPRHVCAVACPFAWVK